MREDGFFAVHKLSSLKIGRAYDLRRCPDRDEVVSGVIGRIIVDESQHPGWGVVYDTNGKYLVSSGYCEFIEARARD